jgi:hypothetical protein
MTVVTGRRAGTRVYVHIWVSGQGDWRLTETSVLAVRSSSCLAVRFT